MIAQEGELYHHRADAQFSVSGHYFKLLYAEVFAFCFRISNLCGSVVVAKLLGNDLISCALDHF